MNADNMEKERAEPIGVYLRPSAVLFLSRRSSKAFSIPQIAAADFGSIR